MASKTSARRGRPAYLDPSLDADTRVRDLLGRMTLEEKVRQMSTHRINQFLKGSRVSAAAVRAFFKGLSIGCMQDPRIDPTGSAQAVNAVQKYLVERTRLGIPALVISECLHGHLSGDATIFPQAIGLASTWNLDLIDRMARAAAREARAVGVAQALGPDLDLARDPRWGRVEETYGEDPYLVARMGVAYIKGMQGAGPAIDREHLICTAKHYAAHGRPEAGVNLAPVPCGPRELRTDYLPPFQAAVQEAGVLSVMPAYSECDGVPASASRLLLNTILREQWGFRGYVFSDYGAVHMLMNFHRTAHDAAEAGRQALEAGMDLEAPEDFGFGAPLLRLVRKGAVPVELVDQAAGRVLRAKFLAGLFEHPYAEVKKATTVVNCAAHRKLAREIAQESIILLKNDKGLLPLAPDTRAIAIIGPNADTAQLGDYSQVKPAAVTPLQGIRSAVSRRTRIHHAQGCDICTRSQAGFEEAVAAARASDVAIVVIGGTSMAMAGTGWGTNDAFATCGEGFDLTDLGPPGVQEDLVKAVHGTGTPTVVVQVHGRPYSIGWMVDHIPAIVEAWYPGEAGGHALADVLFGRVNPSGKLPVSVPRSVGHVPACYNHKPSARGCYHRPGSPDAPGRDYVFAPTTPLFAFGHGLSYTTFKYTNLRIAPRTILPAGQVQVSVDVSNTGAVAGKEVVQLYVNDVVSTVTTPVKSLRRFAKIALRPGAKQTVSFTLTPDDLKLLDTNMNWVVEPGEFEVMVGGLIKSFVVKAPAT